MQIEIKEVSNCKRELSASIELNRIKEDYQKILMKYRKNVVVHGFRKGKAPLFMIDNIYGKQAIEEYYEEYLPKYFEEIIKEKEISPAAPGSIKKVEWDKKTDLNVTFSYDIEPEFELTNYKEIELPVKLKKFEEQQVDAFLRDIQENFAEVREKEEPAEENNLVTCDIKITNNDGREIIVYGDKIYQIGTKYLGEQFDKDLIGVKKGDRVETTIEYFDKDTIEKFSDIVDLTEGKDVIVYVKDVQIKELPPLDDELAKDTGEYETLDEMKDAIRKDIQKDVENSNRMLKEEAWFNYVMEKNDFEVPESKAEQLAARTAMNFADVRKLREDEIKGLLEIFKKPAMNILKKHYILEKLTELETAEVTDEEIENEIIHQANEHNMEVEKYKKFYKKQLKREDLKKQLMQEKILENIVNSCKIVEPKEKIDTEKMESRQEQG